MDVMHDREKPGPQIGPAAVEVELGPRPLERVLDQVVGGSTVADQRASVAPQPRNQVDKALGFIHRGNKASATPIPCYFPGSGNGGSERRKAIIAFRSSGVSWLVVLLLPPPFSLPGRSLSPLRPAGRNSASRP